MSLTTDRAITIKTTAILKIIAILLSLAFLWLIRDIIALLIVALFLAALMHPAARFGARYRIPKGVMVIAIYLAIFGLAATAFALILPPLLEQVGRLSQTIGSSVQLLTSGVQHLKTFSDQYGLANNVTAGVASLQSQIESAAGGIVATLTSVFGGFVGLAIVLVMAYYMVVQDKEAIRLFRNLVPAAYQEKSSLVLMHVEEKIGRWLSGQLFLMLLIGVFYYIGLLVLGIPSPLPLAIFGAFTEFIPYLGPILGGIPVVIVAFSVSPFKALLSLGLMILVQQLESQIIVPKVMQKAVGLNPLISIVAVLVGAQLFGIIGAILSIPVATALSVALTELYRYHQNQES